MTVGKTKDVGFQIGVRKSLPLSLNVAWNLITSKEGLAIWLGTLNKGEIAAGSAYHLDDDSFGETRVFNKLSHIRLTWQPVHWTKASTIQVRVIPNGTKTTISFHQENLPGPDEREQRRLYFKKVLKELQDLINNPSWM